MTKLPRANKFNARKSYRCLACGAAQPGKVEACTYCREPRVHTFDSRAEARHYDALRTQLNAGFITELQIHPRFELTAHGKKIGTYTADFCYVVPGQGVRVIDVKGRDTDASRLRRKLFSAQTGIPVEVVRR